MWPAAGAGAAGVRGQSSPPAVTPPEGASLRGSGRGPGCAGRRRFSGGCHGPWTVARPCPPAGGPGSARGEGGSRVTATRGYIVPVGGAEDKMGDVAILRRFAILCGGNGCRIAIIPTASTQSETGSRYEELFHSLGVREAKALPIMSRADCEHREWLDLLDQVD